MKDRLIEIPLDRLKNALWNYKTDDEEKEAKLTANLQRNGQVQNLIVRELPKGYYEIVDGNHRLAALRQAGVKNATCFNCGKISLANAKRLSVEVNESRYANDDVRFAAVIRDLVGEFKAEDLARTLFLSEEEIANLATLENFNWDEGRVDEKAKGVPEQFVRMEFMVAPAQEEVINRALDRIIDGIPLAGDNPRGRALEFICADSLNTPLESLK